MQIADVEKLKKINERIKTEFSIETYNELQDSKLMPEYKQCKSVKNAIYKLSHILKKYDIEDKIKDSIIDDYLLDLIPPGTKGSIRGFKFNKIIENKINDFNLNKDLFEIKFEKQCKICITTEIPDWYILEIKTNKVLIGMNQLDLTGGGQQMNRGSKYLIDNIYYFRYYVEHILIVKHETT